ncbi:hypothetical protein GFS24_15470 [Chitinophaga sp. SYP-B3965]|uniref:carboxypeptidase-like regulatory domain-containing protein n=1 Tax=Chitinophaga sp. SYP-B3965 TaxID=2663120 RepID=UPI0012999944|nr:carboxypeptidase-like regulatory domain-containing protein [Chitinophaga sp. SYP-B3965]MRG46521.1 hypothetical protein [Chitinophaga sp. SYP-B3965]
MNRFLPFLLLFSLTGFAQQKSVYIINGREVDSADLAGVKVKKIDVVTGPRNTGMHERAGRRVLIVHLEDEQYNLFGIVTNERGKPVQNAKVNDVLTDACGHFYLKGVKAGSRITISRKGYADQFIDVYKRPDDLLTVQLKKKS